MRLVDERTNSFVEDPSNSKEIKYRATTEEKVPYKVLDSEARAELDKKSQVAADAYAERRATALELKQRMPEFGVAKHDDINSAAKLQDLVDQKTQEIARDNSLDAAQKREKLERLATMESLAQQYNAQLSTAKNLSKEMGDIGTVANILDPVARPGAVLLTPFDGFFDGSNTIDVGAFLPAREAGPGDPGREPTFVINEAKGGTSRLGYAETPNGRAEQGSPEYLQRTLAIDRNLQQVLSETPQQMIARGIDLNSPEGKAYIQARNEMLRAFADGTLQYESNKIQVGRDGTVTEARFVLERDGKPFSVDVLGRIDRERALEILRDYEAYERAVEVERVAERAQAIEMIQGRVTDSIELATNRDLTSIQDRIGDYLAAQERGLSKREAQREAQKMIQEAERQIGYARDELLRFVDEAGQTLRPEVFDAWREGTLATVIEEKISSGMDMRQVVVLDLGPNREPALVGPDSIEQRLAAIERLASEGLGAFQINNEYNRPQQYTAELSLDSREQVIERAKQIVVEGWQTNALNAARQAGQLAPETDAIRERVIDAINRAAERQLTVIPPHHRNDTGRNLQEYNVHASAQALRIEVNDRILAGVDLNLHNAWKNATATISFEVTQDPDRMLTYIPVSPEGGAQLVPTDSPERALAWIENCARGGRDLSDIRALLAERDAATAEFTVESREQALNQGSRVFPERQALLDRVIPDLQQAIDRHVPGESNVSLDPVTLSLVPRIGSEIAGREMQQRVVEYVRAGFDRDVYQAWRESTRVLPLNIEQNGNREAMAILEREGREPMLVPRQSPERALALIAQAAEAGQRPEQIGKMLNQSSRSEVTRVVADSPEKAAELGRKMLAQARDMTRAIDIFEERSLTSDPNSSEGNQCTRDEIQQIRDTVEQMIERGVDPSTVDKARQALDRQVENSLTVETDRNGRPEVVFRADEDGRTIRWSSDERALAQVLNEVERGRTPAQVLDTLGKNNRECPPSFQERFTNSEQYRQWQASERERELREREMNERRRRNSLARGQGRGPQGLGLER
jgi:hypothetical protein